MYQEWRTIVQRQVPQSILVRMMKQKQMILPVHYPDYLIYIKDCLISELTAIMRG